MSKVKGKELLSSWWHPVPRDPVTGSCLRRSSTMKSMIPTRVNKLNTRLIEAVPNIAYMRRMLEMGANPNATCRVSHLTACHIAAMHDSDALDLLLRAGADRSRSDKHGRTPLHLAAWAGNAKQIALLLNFPEALKNNALDRVRLSSKTLEDLKSLQVNKLTNVPCRLNKVSTQPDEWCDGMEHQCKNNKDILPLFQHGWTALHSASARAHHHCVQLLLAVGADVSAQDLLCRTPLDVAGCAHYMGHNINVNKFMETVDLLLTAGGQFQNYSDKSILLDTPLHTAVELESQVAVEQLLLGGASATVWNSQGLTAMHICIKKRNKVLLQMLANHHGCSDNPDLAVVDVKDLKGSTVLCAAVKAEWIEGVCIALRAGASTIMQPNGELPIHIAAQLGNIDIMQNILNIVTESTIDYCNNEGDTALFIAVTYDHLDVVKLLLKNGSNIEVKNWDHANVLHVAAEHGRKEILEYLLKYDSNVKEKLINMSDFVGPPLHNAVKNNHPVCASLLISNGARVDAKCYGNSTTLLHIAARKNLCEIAEVIIRHDSETIHSLNDLGWTPLHVACYYGNREMIKLLLHYGADLSGAINKTNSDCTKQTALIPFEILMDRVTKPNEFMREIFDSYITIKRGTCQEPVCEVEIDYRVLVPTSDKKQVEVIKALVNTETRYDQDCLLLHPFVQSFLYLRWSSLLYYFYGISAVVACYLFSLNVIAVSFFWYKDRKFGKVPSIFHTVFWMYFFYLTAGVVAILELIFITTKGKRIILCKEMWLRVLSVSLAITLPTIVSWNSEQPSECVRLFVSVTLILNFAKMMFMLSRFPEFGYYVLMFGKVANKVFKILALFIFVIFGFSVSFMIQFHARHPFEDPWSALMTTMVMMTSELGYYETIIGKGCNETVNNETVNNESGAHASTINLHLTFMAFLILISIVLMNLLVGVAVNDVNNLEIMGNIQRLKKQVEFMTTVEDAGRNKVIKKYVPSFLYKFFYEDIKRVDFFVMRSQSLYIHKRSPGCSLPARLRQAIFENALLRKKQKDDERRTKLFEMKLDEVHKAIVKNDCAEATTTERLCSLDTAVKKILEELNKIRAVQDRSGRAASQYKSYEPN